jgi:hypothetical protein
VEHTSWHELSAEPEPSQDDNTPRPGMVFVSPMENLYANRPSDLGRSSRQR